MSISSIASTLTTSPAYASSYGPSASGSDAGSVTAPSPVAPVQSDNRRASDQQDTYTRDPEAQRKAEAERSRAEREPQTPASGKEELTHQEERQLRDLKKRDAEVRRHEQAHLQAAGQYGIGPPKYEYQRGPDGKDYAIGGHVRIDTSPVKGDPEATLRKAQIVYRAALAPEEPSQQDRKIANKAKVMEAKAREDLRELQLAERKAEQAEKEQLEATQAIKASGAGTPSIAAQTLGATQTPGATQTLAAEDERLDSDNEAAPPTATITEGSPLELARLDEQDPQQFALRTEQATLTRLFEPRESTSYMAAATYAAGSILPMQTSTTRLNLVA